jgi:hypothetical protein
MTFNERRRKKTSARSDRSLRLLFIIIKRRTTRFGWQRDCDLIELPLALISMLTNWNDGVQSQRTTDGADFGAGIGGRRRRRQDVDNYAPEKKSRTGVEAAERKKKRQWRFVVGELCRCTCS